MTAGCAVAALVIARAATLLRYDIWFDELYSLYAASGDPAGVWATALADRVHPPGFYYLLWGWLQLVPPTPLGLRMLPFLVWLGILGAAWWAGRRAGLDREAGCWLLLLVAANPLLFDLGAFVRDYGLVVLATTVALGAAAALLHDTPERPTRHTVILGLAAIAAVWSHLFAWPVLGILALALALRRRWLAAATALVVPALSMVPWVLALLHAAALDRGFAENVGWQATPTVVGVLTMPGALLAARPDWAGWLLAIPAWLLLAIGARRREQRHLTGSVVGPMALALVATMLAGVAVWEIRYLAVAVVPLLLLLVLAAHTSPRPWRTVLLVVVVLGVVGVATPATWRIPWRSITERLASSNGQPVNVYAFEGFTILPVRYYALMDDRKIAVPEIKTWPTADTPPGWLLLRPITLGDSLRPGAILRAAGRAVSDSFVVGTGTNAIAAWRFE